VLHEPTRCVLAVLVFGAAGFTADPSSSKPDQTLGEAHKGKVAVAVKHLETGEEFYLHADEPMPTASLIKLSVMSKTYWQAHEGKIKLDTPSR